MGQKSSAQLRVFLTTMDQWRFAKSSGDTNGYGKLKTVREMLLSKAQKDRGGGQVIAEDSCAQKECPLYQAQGFCPKH